MKKHQLITAGSVTKIILVFATILVILVIAKKIGFNENVATKKYLNADSIKQTRIVTELIEKLKDSDVSERKNAAATFANIRDLRGIEPLIAALKDRSSFVRNTAAEALSTYGPVATEPLIDALSDQNENVRKFAAEILGEIGDVRAVGSLIETIDDVNWKVGQSAVLALGNIGDAQSIAVLTHLLENKNLRNRINAAQALSMIDDTCVVEGFINALKDNHEAVRRISASALGDLGDERAVEPLIKALRDSDKSVQNSILNALVKLGDIRAIPKIADLMSDWEAGRSSALALRKLNWKPESMRDKIHLLVVEKNGIELKNLWDDTKSVLLNDVESNNYRVIQNAIFAFIALGKQEIIPELIEILNTKGTKTTAEVFLNCGNSELSSAARSWAISRGYTITSARGNSAVQWGKW